MVVPVLDSLQALLDLVEVVARPQLRDPSPHQVRNLRLGAIGSCCSSIHGRIDASMRIVLSCIILAVASGGAV